MVHNFIAMCFLRPNFSRVVAVLVGIKIIATEVNFFHRFVVIDFNAVVLGDEEPLDVGHSGGGQVGPDDRDGGRPLRRRSPLRCRRSRR